MPFNGSFDLTISATDIPNLENTTSFSTAFDRCFSLETIPNIDIWNTEHIERFDRMFHAVVLFNDNISTWNTANAKEMSGMFLKASSFNQDLSNWNTSNVIDMHEMFKNAISFDQDLSSWDISNVQSMNGMFANITLSTTNYNALLIGWESQDVQNNVIFNGGNSKYSSTVAAVARQSLINDHNWTITDGGFSP